MNVNSINKILFTLCYAPGLDFELIDSYIGEDGARHVYAKFPRCRFPNLTSIHRRFCAWRVRPDSVDPDGRYFYGLRFLSTRAFDGARGCDNYLRCLVAEPEPRGDDSDESDASTEVCEWLQATAAEQELDLEL